MQHIFGAPREAARRLDFHVTVITQHALNLSPFQAKSNCDPKNVGCKFISYVQHKFVSSLNKSNKVRLKIHFVNNIGGKQLKHNKSQLTTIKQSIKQQSNN